MTLFRGAFSIILSASMMSVLSAFAQGAGPGEISGLDRPLSAAIQAESIAADVTVTDSQLLNSARNDNDWLLHGRTYDNQRFSPLKQINSASVKRLVPVSIIQTGVANSFETTPIVVNGIMYIVTAGDHVQAYDAVTGEVLWVYNPVLKYSDLCCGPVSRGPVVAYGKVFVAQLDGVVIALDARNGSLAWRSDPAITPTTSAVHYSFTAAPQIYDGMVIIGSSGAEYPTRGFVVALDASTGKLIWRFNTTAAPDEPGGDTWSGDSWKAGGGAVWNTPAIDTKNGLVSFGTGNPNPNIDGEDRKGDNAYTDSIVALHVKDGTLAWWYQEVAHDLWDFDAAGPVIFLDVRDAHGGLVPAAAEAGKEGQLFIVNRLTGKLVRSSPSFVLESSNKWVPPSTTPGEPHYPSASGGGEWSPSAYSPLTRAIYVMGSNVAWTYTVKRIDPQHPPIGMSLGGIIHPLLDGVAANTIEPSGNLSAINVDTGKIGWRYQSSFPMVGGVLATAGNLVFAGEMDGNFDAFAAKNGTRLWHFNLGSGVNAPPITYRVNGVQYVAVAAGGNGANGNNELLAKRGHPQFGDVLAIFALSNAH